MSSWITLDNVQAVLERDDAVQLSYVYSYKNRRFWKLMSPLRVVLSTGKAIVIPEGFYTDLSSVPRWLWSVAPPFGDFLLASVIHDYLYSYNVGDRPSADREMLIWSNALNSNKIDNHVRYIAVRIFGASWWNRAAKRLAATS
jgi:hypothetical protein